MSLQTHSPGPTAFLALVMALPQPFNDDDIIGRWHDDGGQAPGDPAEDAE